MDLFHQVRVVVQHEREHVQPHALDGARRAEADARIHRVVLAVLLDPFRYLFVACGMVRVGQELVRTA